MNVSVKNECLGGGEVFGDKMTSKLHKDETR